MDKPGPTELGSRILKVNHAGENGAIHIYAGLLVLEGKDAAAVQAISQIVVEEQHHHDQSASHLSGSRFWPRILTPVVAASTESVIWLGMRL